MKPRATTDELKLKLAVKRGQEAFENWKEPAPRPIIRADVVKELVVGANAERGVQIRGARIVDGPLDLKEARGASGGACNALILSNCVLTGKQSDSMPGCPGIDARHSHLQRLSLVKCQTEGVELSSAIVVGDLDLDELHPREDDDAPNTCWVKARGIRIGGSLAARRARLSLPWRPDPEWTPVGAHDCWLNLRAPFALDLQGSEIAGSLVLQPSFDAVGGVNVAGSSIGGDLWAQGAHLSKSGVGRASTEALHGQSVEINGHAMFGCDWLDGRGRFTASGTLDFYGARIGGLLMLSGAQITDEDGWAALNLYSASCAADVHINEDASQMVDDEATPCEIPTMDLSTASIGGKLHIQGSSVAPVRHVDATGVQVAGDLTVAGSHCMTDLSGSVANGNLKLGTERAPFALQPTPEGEAPVLNLAGARVGRALEVVAPITTPRFPVDLASTEPVFRSTGLLTYPGWRLAEASFGESDDAAIVAFLYRRRNLLLDRKPGVLVLNGDASRIHQFNETHPPLLHSEAQVREYLSLFCNYLWTDEGAFLIVGDTLLVAPATAENESKAKEALGHSPARGSWQAVGTVEHGSSQYQATFLIEPSGDVVMIDDDEILAGLDHPVRYDPPMRWVKRLGEDWPIPGPLGLELTAQPPPAGLGRGKSRVLKAATTVLGKVEFRILKNSVRKELRREVEKRPGPSINLMQMRAGLLNDANGQSWSMKDNDDWGTGPKLQLALGGFEYDQIADAAPPTRPSISDADVGVKFRVAAREKRRESKRMLENRRRWLNAQYKAKRPTDAEYRPQPYQQLARVWRAGGYLNEADDVAYDKLKLEKVRLSKPGLSPIKRAWHFTKQLGWFSFVQIPFGFGLRPWRAAATFLVVYLLGLAAIVGLAGSLKVEASPVATVLSGEGRGERVIVEEVNVPELRRDEEVNCGAHINKLIYPLDVMIPLIDLRQESRCHFSITNAGWGAAKGFYAIVGWIVTSGLILTLSGVVRRRIEG